MNRFAKILALVSALALLGLDASQAAVGGIVGGGSGSGGGITTHVTYVSAAGANNTNNGRVYTNAAFRMPVGINSLIVVGPGEYYIQTNTMNLLPAIGRMLCYPGARFTKGDLAHTAPRWLISDVLTPITNEYVGWGEFWMTNNSTGNGGVIRITSSSSKVDFEADVNAVVATGGFPVANLVSAGELNYNVRGMTYCDQYDAFITGSTAKARLKSTRVLAGDSLIECFNSTTWGNVVADFGACEILSLGYDAAVVMADNVHVRIATITLGHALSIRGPETNSGATGSGILEIGLADWSLSNQSFIHPQNPIYGTSFTLRNSTVLCPNNVNPISLETFNGTAQPAPLTVQNCRFVDVGNGTNLVTHSGYAGGGRAIRWVDSSTTRQLKPATNVTFWATKPSVLDRVVTPVVSAGTAATNIYVAHIPRHQLTNSGDAIEVQARGTFSGDLGGNTTFQWVYGSQTILNTGSQTSSNGSWSTTLRIQSTGATAQTCDGWLQYAAQAAPFLSTNKVVNSAQTNGIDTAVRLVVTTANNGQVTNLASTLTFIPAQ